MRAQALRDLAASPRARLVGAVLLFWAVALAPLAFIGRWLVVRWIVVGEGLTYVWPMREAFFRELAAGELPLWTESVQGGYPTMAQISGAWFHPPTWLYLFLPSHVAQHFTVVIPWIVATLGAAALALRLGRGATAALLAGLVYGGCGWMTSPMAMGGTGAPAAAWLPWVLWAIAGLGEHPWRRETGFLAMAVALMLVAGTPAVALDGIVVALAFAAWRAWGAVGVARRRAVWTGTVAAVALAAVMALPAYVGAFEAVSRAGRADLWGSPPPGPRAIAAALWIVPFAFVLAGWARKSRAAGFWWLLAGVSVTLVIGELAGVAVPAILPPDAHLRYVAPLALGLAMLAAIGLEIWRASPSDPIGGRLAAVGVIVLLIGPIVIPFRPAPTVAVALGASLIALGGWRGVWRISSVLAAVAAMFACGVGPWEQLRRAGRGTSSSSFAKTLKVEPRLMPTRRVLLCGDIGFLGPDFRLLDTRVMPNVAGLERMPLERIRLAWGAAPGESDPVCAPNVFPRGHIASDLLGVQLIREPMRSYWNRSALRNLGYLRGRGPTPARHSWQQAANPYPFAWLVPSWRAASAEESLASVRTGKLPGGGTWDPRQLALIEPADARTIGAPFYPWIGAEPPDVSLVRWTDMRQTLNVRAPGDALLVVSAINYPGWRATLDGDPVPVVTADGLLRAVRVPPGVHRVELLFRPAWFSWTLSAACVALVIAALLLATGNPPTPSWSPDAPGGEDTPAH